MILAGNKDDIRLVVLRAQEEAKQLTEIINRVFMPGAQPIWSDNGRYHG